ncbi:hypothetical protein NE237_014431 [Protea cynaroides]|uniref:Uncharacterized protein n=1 Tax=Protea cynaroides TaxID=273540 RepID=A0A9Q0KC51_9MAGN|nr:hypothetical protein NE237_014431 [Protea cynaroides]
MHDLELLLLQDISMDQLQSSRPSPVHYTWSHMQEIDFIQGKCNLIRQSALFGLLTWAMRWATRMYLGCKVSSPKEGIHEYDSGLASEDSFGTGDPIEKQTLDGREEDKTETQAPEGSQKASMGSNHHNGIDGGMQSVSSSKDEGEETRNSPLDTKSIVHNPECVEFQNIKFDVEESDIAHIELIVEYGRKLQRSSGDIPRSSGYQDSEEKGQRLEDKVADSLHESNILHSYLEVEKIEKDMPKENMVTQEEEVIDMRNIHGLKSEMIGVIKSGKSVNGIRAENRSRATPTPEVERRGGEEPTLSNFFWNDGRVCRDSQSEAVLDQITRFLPNRSF